jgi:hypothetical protein
VPTVLKSGSLNLLEPSGPVQACNGIALPLTFMTDGWIDEQMEIPSRAFTLSISTKNAYYDKPEYVRLYH